MKICLIIPYFGVFPNYFQLWLKSVKYNKEIDFLIVTDNINIPNCPENLIVKIITFQEFVEKVQKVFEFKISLKRPYKICDYRGAYGEIFEKELRGYDIWGYCDIDLIFGNIKKFITDKILKDNERVNMHGHLSFYKNNKKINTLYKKEFNELISYKQVFTNDWSYHFDEYPGMAYITKYSGIKFVDIEEFADIDRFSYCFRKVYDRSEKEDDNTTVKQIFKWKDGELKNIIYNDGELIEKEVMYIHLQKRKMAVRNNIEKDSFLIVPNSFIDDEIGYNQAINEYCNEKAYSALNEFKKECFRQKFRFSYWKMKKHMIHKKWKD